MHFGSSSLSSSSCFFLSDESYCFGPSFHFSQVSLSQTVESSSFVASNQVALNTHYHVFSSLIKILNFQTSVCYVPSFKLTSEWVNPNLTLSLDLNKRLVGELALVHLITRRRQ